MSFVITPFINVILFSSIMIVHGIPIAPLYQNPLLVQSSSLGLPQFNPIYGKQLVDVDAYNNNPQYSFAYKVEDGYTGDSKSQEESRNGDAVKGQYSLNDADGYRRIVDYTSDGVNGFNAIVTRQPIAVKPIITQPIIKTVSKAILQPVPTLNVPSNYYPLTAGPSISAQSLYKSAPALLSSYTVPQSIIKTLPLVSTKY